MNRLFINKGIKKLAYSLPLLFIGPSVIYNAFMNKENSWHYLVLAIGITLCVFSMYLIFKGIYTLTKGIFNDQN